MGQPEVDPELFRYLILITAHPAYIGRRTAANARSLEVVPENTLSVVLSNPGTNKALIKIPGADPVWIADNAWAEFEDAPNGVLRIFTRSTHHLLMDLLGTDPDWSDQQVEET